MKFGFFSFKKNERYQYYDFIFFFVKNYFKKRIKNTPKLYYKFY